MTNFIIVEDPMNAHFTITRRYVAIVRGHDGLTYAECFAPSLDLARQKIIDFEGVSERAILVIEERND